MKIKHLLLSAIAVATALVSCQKDFSKEKASISLSVAEVNFESTKTDKKTITLSSTNPWKAEIPTAAKKWVSVSPVQGEASADPQTIEITVKDNGGFNHSADITFKNAGGFQILKVNQNGDMGEAVPGDGSLENPYLASQARAKAETLGDNEKSDKVYVKGIVHKIKSIDTGNYGNAEYYISDNGSSSSDDLPIFRGYYLNGVHFTSEDQLKVGDAVVVYGQLTKYVGTQNNPTPQMAQGSELIIINGKGAEVETISAEGLVVALTAKAIVIKTSDGYAYAFSKNGISGVAVGDYVNAEGKASTHAGISQIEDPKITVQSSGTDVQHTTPTIIGADNIEGFSKAFEYVRLSGTLVKSGNFYNITIPGSSKQGSLSYPVTDYSSFDNSMVDVEGYFVGWTSKNGIDYFNIATVSVVESNASYFFVSPDSFNVPASATSVSIEINSNVDWTVLSDNPAFAVSSASGKGKASVKVTFDANKEPTVKTAKITVATTAEVTTTSYEITITQAAYQEGVQSATLNFKGWGFDGAKDWGTGYAAHTVEFDVATVNFGSAIKQTTTITDCPVTKGNAPITVVMKSGLKITGIKINGKQWGDKTKTMSLFTSTDGGATYGETSVAKSSTFVLDAPALADGIDAVKIDFSEGSNQIGIESIVVSYK